MEKMLDSFNLVQNVIVRTNVWDLKPDKLEWEIKHKLYGGRMSNSWSRLQREGTKMENPFHVFMSSHWDVFLDDCFCQAVELNTRAACWIIVACDVPEASLSGLKASSDPYGCQSVYICSMFICSPDNNEHLWWNCAESHGESMDFLIAVEK